MCSCVCLTHSIPLPTFSPPHLFPSLTLFTHPQLHPPPSSPTSIFTHPHLHPPPSSPTPIFTHPHLHPPPSSPTPIFTHPQLHPPPSSPTSIFTHPHLHPPPSSPTPIFTHPHLHPPPSSPTPIFTHPHLHPPPSSPTPIFTHPDLHPLSRCVKYSLQVSQKLLISRRIGESDIDTQVSVTTDPANVDYIPSPPHTNIILGWRESCYISGIMFAECENMITIALWGHTGPTPHWVEAG